MINFEDYIINGKYENSIMGEGAFRGEIRAYEDERIVGVMSDNGGDISNPRERKLIFGIGRKEVLAFWKLNPNIRHMPVFYVLAKVDGLPAFDGKYIGKFGFVNVTNRKIIRGVDGRKPLPELEACFKSEDNSKVLELLSQIDRERINSYLKSKFVQNIANGNGHRGYAEIEKVLSLAV